MVSLGIYCLMLGSGITKLGPVRAYGPTYIYNQAIRILLPKIMHFICIPILPPLHSQLFC